MFQRPFPVDDGKGDWQAVERPADSVVVENRDRESRRPAIRGQTGLGRAEGEGRRSLDENVGSDQWFGGAKLDRLASGGDQPPAKPPISRTRSIAKSCAGPGPGTVARARAISWENADGRASPAGKSTESSAT